MFIEVFADCGLVDEEVVDPDAQGCTETQILELDNLGGDDDIELRAKVDTQPD